MAAGVTMLELAQRSRVFPGSIRSDERGASDPVEQTILVSKTKTGIVTVQVLNINDPARVMLRENLLFEGRFPPEE
jgi:hypothetical protein